MSNNKTTKCRDCSEQLYFVRNENGKFVPMEYYSNQPHDCPERESYVYELKPIFCNYCKKRITFKETVKSPSGKFIPLDYVEAESASDYKGKYTPHRCEQNPYYALKNNNNRQGQQQGQQNKDKNPPFFSR